VGHGAYSPHHHQADPDSESVLIWTEGNGKIRNCTAVNAMLATTPPTTSDPSLWAGLTSTHHHFLTNVATASAQQMGQSKSGALGRHVSALPMVGIVQASE
jgi:hypothetical protein